LRKIAIVGPGAMGCLYASLLAKSKEEVWLVDKDFERALKIKEGGLTLETASGKSNLAVKATADIKEISEAGLVIISVKSYDTKVAITRVKPLVGNDTLVLTLQNGLGNIEIISEAVGAERVIGGVTSMGSTLIGHGHVRHAGEGDTIIGRLDGRTPVDLRHIREVFNKAGIVTKISRDIKGLLWSKLIINIGINALTAITRLTNGRLLEFENTRKILREAVSEATRIAKRKRIKLIYDDPLAKTEAVCEATAENVSSMLQDVLKKKRTEIDFINGVIVRQGQELGIPVPVNALLAGLVKTIESSYSLALNK